jgi:hypothetical protein
MGNDVINVSAKHHIQVKENTITFAECVLNVITEEKQFIMDNDVNIVIHKRDDTDAAVNSCSIISVAKELKRDRYILFTNM